jgi:Leucine-rich repeat (LRR) protein
LRAVIGHATGKKNVDVDLIHIENRKEFTAIPKKIGDIFSNLKAINITNTPLTYFINEQVRNMKRLTRLCLINTKITYLPDDAFNGLGNLNSIYIIGNKIERFTRAMLSPMKRVKLVYLNNNLIEDLPSDLFDDLLVVKGINLAGNFLKKIPEGLFDTSVYVNTLFLENNQIVNLAKDVFKNNQDLERINLSGNRLKTIDFDFTKIRELILVQLEGNECINKVYAVKINELQNDIRRNCSSDLAGRTGEIGNNAVVQKIKPNDFITFPTDA